MQEEPAEAAEAEAEAPHEPVVGDYASKELSCSSSGLLQAVVLAALVPGGMLCVY